MTGGVYLHVPFCGSRCSYCHFARTATHDAVSRRRVVQAMIREFDLRRRACPGLADGRHEVATVYVGGGTPSLLEPLLLQQLLGRTVDRLPGPRTPRSPPRPTPSRSPPTWPRSGARPA